jgi:hypothetical protein
MSKQAKLLAAFQTGKQFTAKQIAASFGLKDPIATVRTLREAGHCIYANDVKLWDGTQSVKYRLGTPSRRMVAVAARTIGAAMFSR